MNQDSFSIKFPFFSISKTDSTIKLNEGDTILIKYWSWRRFGHIRKILTLQDGVISVKRVNDGN